MVRDQFVRFLRMTPLLSARPMAAIATAVECTWVIYFYKKIISSGKLCHDFHLHVHVAVKELLHTLIDGKLIKLFHCLVVVYLILAYPGSATFLVLNKHTDPWESKNLCFDCVPTDAHRSDHWLLISYTMCGHRIKLCMHGWSHHNNLMTTQKLCITHDSCYFCFNPTNVHTTVITIYAHLYVPKQCPL